LKHLLYLIEAEGMGDAKRQDQGGCVFAAFERDDSLPRYTGLQNSYKIFMKNTISPIEPILYNKVKGLG
jgi:hypothetical protein